MPTLHKALGQFGDHTNPMRYCSDISHEKRCVTVGSAVWFNLRL